jgi:hypothetical protein
VRRGAAAAALALPLLLVAGCGGADEAMSSASGGSALDAPGQVGAPERDTGAGDPAADGDARTETSGRAATLTRKVVYRGQVEVRVRDVARAADRVEAIVLGVDGLVSAEESSGTSRSGSGRDLAGPTEARLTVRVPPSSFRRVLDRVGGLGRELSRTQTAKDMTTQVVDVASRVESQERSVARVRTLLAEATDIGEVVAIESELARREADLDSLKAQLAALEDTTDLATIEVGLLERAAPRPVPPDDDLGFLAGLRGGWDALAGVVLVAVTVAGAVLPFLLALTVPALGAALLLRRRRPAAAQPAETS